MENGILHTKKMAILDEQGNPAFLLGISEDITAQKQAQVNLLQAKKSAELFLKAAGHMEIVIKDFRDGFFPYIGGKIKEYFEELKKEVAPDIIFTPFRNDLHQDHRLLSELTWNTFRNHLILEYEILKYDGDLGAPNFFIHISKEIARRKIENIFEVFKTQGHRSWFTEDAFYSIMRLRGIESNALDRYAEAFYCRKMIF